MKEIVLCLPISVFKFSDILGTTSPRQVEENKAAI